VRSPRRPSCVLLRLGFRALKGQGAFRDDEDLVIVASKGGFPKHPAWYHNLIANPDVTVQVGSKKLPVHARVAKPEEREKLWKLAVAGYHGYEDYKARTDREIPLVVLEPR
jgi:deazaflavin-dependent oxidoreductase (nitroreductase family)